MGPRPFWIENWKTSKIHINCVEDWFKKKMDRWVGGRGELYPNFWMSGICLTLQGPLVRLSVALSFAANVELQKQLSHRHLHSYL